MTLIADTPRRNASLPVQQHAAVTARKIAGIITPRPSPPLGSWG
jgi:hypothetical protein